MSETTRNTQLCDVSTIASTLAELHEFVTRTNGRIELTRPGSDERCILVSKAELECIEKALEILSDTDDFRDLCGKIAQVAAAAGPEQFATA